MCMQGVKATGVRTPPTFDLQGSINALDPCNNCYIITTQGREREEQKGMTPQYLILKCVVLTPMRRPMCSFGILMVHALLCKLK